jgi:hypothetical protein
MLYFLKNVYHKRFRELGYSAEYIKKIKSNGYSTQKLIFGIGSTVLALVGFFAFRRGKFIR